MPWQKIKRTNGIDTVVVESKSGNTYPVEVEYNHMGRGIYEQITNQAHDHLTFWAWINFDGDNAVLEDYTRKNDDEPPQKPPWE